MNTMALVKSILNEMTILDFYNNYDKSETYRIIFGDSEEIIEKQNTIKELLYSLYDKKKYRIEVSTNHVSICEIIDQNDISMTLQERETIWSDNFHKLPYAWVMSRKISKRAMENAIKEMI